ncbi:hypothetical protein, partial [Thiolapillus sp.]|uniref:hypothetical protein n=1 Tax=Thiolapillus sp. TaxID=2017437 RepID=UPI003AF7061A
GYSIMSSWEVTAAPLWQNAGCCNTLVCFKASQTKVIPTQAGVIKTGSSTFHMDFSMEPAGLAIM